MKKFLKWLGISVALLVGAVGILLATGTIDSTHLRTNLKMILNVAAGIGGPSTPASKAMQNYRVPEGFELELYADDVPNARFLHFTPTGDLLVARYREGDVVLLGRDANNDGRADGLRPLIENLKQPAGLDLVDGWLYFAESHQVSRVRFDATAGSIVGEPELIIEGLADNGDHPIKTLQVGPDNLLYLTDGSSCNVCEESDSHRATMTRSATDGSNVEIVATGLRNSSGFDWAPWNGELYATDNGRDLLGDDFPPCELNLIETGNFYGWPYFNGDNVPDPDIGEDPLAATRRPTAPVHGFRAHNAPLGMRFISAENWPEAYRRSALVALHGSWNRSVPDGYKVVSLHWTDQGIEERDFLSGFNRDGVISGRPVDVVLGPDGAAYISDDYAEVIYRVRPTGK